MGNGVSTKGNLVIFWGQEDPETSKIRDQLEIFQEKGIIVLEQPAMPLSIDY